MSTLQHMHAIGGADVTHRNMWQACILTLLEPNTSNLRGAHGALPWVLTAHNAATSKL